MYSDTDRFALDALARGNDIVVAEVLATSGSTPRKAGSVMVVASDGRMCGTVGGGRVESRIKEECRRHLEQRIPNAVYTVGITTEINGADDNSCGTMDVQVSFYSKDAPDSFVAKPVENAVAYIFGGGHVGLALEGVLRGVGFETVVIDDRPNFASRERFPDAHKIISCTSCVSAVESLPLNSRSFVFVMTYSQQQNFEIVRRVLDLPHGYLGLLGSRRKVATIADLLSQEGRDVYADARFFAPIGDDISAETPAEIAISIAAQAIRERAAINKQASSVPE